MKAGWAMASAAAAVGGTLAWLGLVIARNLTAPAGDRTFDLTVRGVEKTGERTIVVLDRTTHTGASGIYCLILENGGWVRLSKGIVDRGTGRVGRVVEDLSGELRAGDKASWSGIFFSSPADAGLTAMDVWVPTDVGPAPAWLIRPPAGPSTTWAIHIHGLGSPRAGTLRGVQVAAEAGLTSLVVTYRNDGGGPTVGAGRSELGAAETDDVRAAVRFARENGARSVILFGWSMGAGIALQLAKDPELGVVVNGLVLESPVLDWVSTIRANCSRASLPEWAGAFALPWLNSWPLARLIGLPNPVPLRRFDWIARADELTVLTLILHGTHDSSSPFEVSSRLRELRPDIVRLEEFEADHTMSWNSDRERWRTAVRGWLTSLGALG
ncbi:alpha/beta hydrolase family protein [Cryobacterium zongtaii]|nr:alpha/beta fold hydrolase [Cryobacterium zongtaii]